MRPTNSTGPAGKLLRSHLGRALCVPGVSAERAPAAFELARPHLRLESRVPAWGGNSRTLSLLG